MHPVSLTVGAEVAVTDAPQNPQDGLGWPHCQRENDGAPRGTGKERPLLFAFYFSDTHNDQKQLRALSGLFPPCREVRAGT